MDDASLEAIVGAGGVDGSGDDELRNMLERDLKSQLEQQQRQRESRLKLAKAGGSFRDKNDISEAKEGMGAQRRFTDAANDILDGVKEQRLIQMSMGSFSQLGGILSAASGGGQEYQQQRPSLSEVASRIGRARPTLPLLSPKRQQTINIPLTSPKGGRRSIPGEKGGVYGSLLEGSSGKGKNLNPFAS